MMSYREEEFRIDRFQCVTGTWTYVVVYSRSCVMGYFKSRKAARAFIQDLTDWEVGFYRED